MAPTFTTTPASAGPKLHVLAIGVGAYPYLQKTPDGDTAPNPLSLEQLTSPPISVKALAEFFLGVPFAGNPLAYSNPDLPLGSLWALSSAVHTVEVTTPQGPKDLVPATRDNISAAFGEWLEAMRADPSNVGVFYFCGHGVMLQNQYLLASDFGVSQNEPWSKAFDLDDTIAAVNRQVRGSVYYFVDACREFSEAMARTRGGAPTALLTPIPANPVIRTSTTVVRATGEGEVAFSETDSVSRFTSALLTVMSGYCGDRPPASGYWEVNGANLSAAIWQYLKFASPQDQLQTSEQTINGKAAVALVKHVNEPRVKVRIEVLPPEKEGQVSVFLRSAANDPWTPQSLDFDTQKGYYDIHFTPTEAGAFGDQLLQRQEIFPPAFKLPIQLP